MQAIVKRQRFDLPKGIEKNPALWLKVRQRISRAFTNHRSEIKKQVIVHAGSSKAVTDYDN